MVSTLVFPFSFGRRTGEGGGEIETKRWKRNERGESLAIVRNRIRGKTRGFRAAMINDRGMAAFHAERVRASRAKDLSAREYNRIATYEGLYLRAMYILSFIFVRVPARRVMASRSSQLRAGIFRVGFFLFFHRKCARSRRVARERFIFVSLMGNLCYWRILINLLLLTVILELEDDPF